MTVSLTQCAILAALGLLAAPILSVNAIECKDIPSSLDDFKECVGSYDDDGDWEYDGSNGNACNQCWFNGALRTPACRDDSQDPSADPLNECCGPPTKCTDDDDTPEPIVCCRQFEQECFGILEFREFNDDGSPVFRFEEGDDCDGCCDDCNWAEFPIEDVTCNSDEERNECTTSITRCTQLTDFNGVTDRRKLLQEQPRPEGPTFCCSLTSPDPPGPFIVFD